MDRLKGILLVGPTGSGKTPLGDLIEQKGLWGRRCFHLDFGRLLRDVAGNVGPAEGFGPAERKFVAGVLERGELLEDEQFGIAEKVLRWFVGDRKAGAGDLVVLNGLPRHTGQARDVDPIVEVRAVVHLLCPEDAALERIRGDLAGDRTGRADDDAESIARKRREFDRRTLPLITHYHERGAVILTVDVGPKTRSEALYARVSGLKFEV